MSISTACFAGTRLEALQALQRFTLVKSIIAAPGSRVCRYCESNGVPVETIDRGNRKRAFCFLEAQEVDLVLSAGFPFILPRQLLQNGSLFVNSHPSLLPAYKGVNAVKQAFSVGEENLGVTVHYMGDEVDAGEQIVQERVWVKGLSLQEVYDLLFGVVEPMAVTRSMEKLVQVGL